MIVGIVKDWLEGLPQDLTPPSEAETQSTLSAVIAEMGYGAPFDREQKTINALLLQHRASRLACLVAWGYYHDAKLIEAHSLGQSSDVRLAG